MTDRVDGAAHVHRRLAIVPTTGPARSRSRALSTQQRREMWGLFRQLADIVRHCPDRLWHVEGVIKAFADEALERQRELSQKRTG